MTKSKFTFPVGFHEFHKDLSFNFQLNRWYSIEYTRFEDREEAGQKINSFEEWKIEMLKLADKAVSEGRLINAEFIIVQLNFLQHEMIQIKNIFIIISLTIFLHGFSR